MIPDMKGNVRHGALTFWGDVCQNHGFKQVFPYFRQIQAFSINFNDQQLTNTCSTPFKLNDQHNAIKKKGLSDMEATYFMGSSVSPSTMDFPEDADNSGSISKLELVAAMQSHSAAAMVTILMSPKPESPKKKETPSISLTT